MKKIILIVLLLQTLSASAVYVNNNGLGDALIIPYYTVNNGLNTLVSITNTTDTSKAIKINIREGLNGYSVTSYNVYLSSFDTWTFVLVPALSTADGFLGQNSATLISSDNSCAPFLQKAGQEFSPTALIDGPQNMSRVREGFIEVFEMGELQRNYAFWVDQGNNGVPNSCSSIETAWQANGDWNEASGGDVSEDVNSGTGGLMAEADVIDVAEGINYSIPVTALDGFFAADALFHVAPNDSSLSLDAAEPKATVVADDKTYQLAFESGIDASSAVLMSNQLFNTYALDAIVAGRSETVFSQPTRRFYVDLENDQITAPYEPLQLTRFSYCTDEQYSGSRVNQIIVDRESQFEYVGDFSSCFFPVEICGSVHIQKYALPGASRTLPEITGSENYSEIITPASSNATENGFNIIEFTNSSTISGTDIRTNRTVEIKGLPMLGVALNKFTNAGAVQGLLSQYGASHAVKSKAVVVETGDDSASFSTVSEAGLMACSQIE